MEDEDSDSPGDFMVVSDHKTPYCKPSYTKPLQSPMAPQILTYNTPGLLGNNPVNAGTPPYLSYGEAQLTLEEKKFLLAVERGDLATVRRTLEKVKGTGIININCVDPLGRSALLMAIDNENLEMVELLIQYKVETKDALLHAIHEEYVEAVEVLLDHEAFIHRPNTPHSWEALDPDVASFTPDITPLILAAHRDNYEIIKILLDRGATLPMPHDVRCGCKECVTSRMEDSLRHSRSRINAYRALASPSLIALSSKDPILTAFELSWELKRLSFLEHEFKNEYQFIVVFLEFYIKLVSSVRKHEALAFGSMIGHILCKDQLYPPSLTTHPWDNEKQELRRQCQDFATSLLDHTRSSYELEVMLNHDPTGPAFEHGERMQLNRLKLAIKYKQKKFVAHPNVQQLLASIWYEGLPGFRRKNVVLQTLQILWIGFLFPLYSIIYIFLPHTTVAETMRKPFIKFIGHSASYITFLILLILASQRIETVIAGTLQPYNDDDDDDDDDGLSTKKGGPPTIVECLILAWVMGLIWAEIKQLWEDGLIEYISDMWNIIDFITNSLYIATIALRVVAYYQVQNEIALDPNVPPRERKDWGDWDPMLISEGLFSAANIFSSLKLVYIFSVNPHLGPLQISLGRMVIDILKFFFVFSLVLFAFACGMNQLLWYYADAEYRHCLKKSYLMQNETDSDVLKNESCIRSRRFSNLFESAQTLFWAVFGLIDLNNFELSGIKSYTRFWGMLMFGSYSVINVVVLLNLLIAMMNHSYQLISDRNDVEWKFARSKLWISYFEEGGTVPPPFNIIPTPKAIYYLFRWFFRKIYGRSRAAKKEHMRTIRRKARQASERDYRYQGIMRNLVRRYVTVEQRKADNQGVTEDDVNEIKQDISSFRYELIEILKNSGMNTSSALDQPQGPGGKKCRLKERRLMKGFNIGRAESFPLSDTSTELAPLMPTGQPATIKSPIGKLKRVAHVASGKHGSRRRWGNLVDAARTVKHTLGRSSSTDSFESQGSIQQVNASFDGEDSTTSPGETEAPGQDSRKANGAGASSMEGHTRMSALRSRLSQLPARFKVPSFDESRSSAKARRHMYGGKIHTGSLKSFVKRTTGPMFASQRIVSKIPAPCMGTSLSSHQEHEHPLPGPAEPMLTPIPSQPSSSNRSSPEPASPSSTPPLVILPSTTHSLGVTGPARTPSPILSAIPGGAGSPESLTMTESCSQEPLVGRRGSSPKPSNGSALLSKLPGVQPVGRSAPVGWL